MQLTIIKGALVPSSDIERMELHKALKAAGIESKIGATFDIAVVHPRNAKFNSKVFAALAEIAQMLGVTPEVLRAQIMYESGRGQDVELRGGEIVTVLPSMSKTAMSMTELKTFWDDAKAYIEKECMISLDGDQQERVRTIFAGNGDANVNPLGAG